MANLIKAKNLAEDLLANMKPYCEQIMIAGSIRRGKREVKDIEICAVPKFQKIEIPSDNLFEPFKEIELNLLWDWARKTKNLVWIKPGTSEIIPWQPKPEGKYWRGILQLDGEPIKLDLFILNPNNWGVLSTIRTGPADFSTALVTFIKNRTRFRVQNGHLIIAERGEIVECPTEADFFRNAGIEFIPVELRENKNPYTLLRLL